jgi:hypothetical protein
MGRINFIPLTDWLSKLFNTIFINTVLFPSYRHSWFVKRRSLVMLLLHLAPVCGCWLLRLLMMTTIMRNKTQKKPFYTNSNSRNKTQNLFTNRNCCNKSVLTNQSLFDGEASNKNSDFNHEGPSNFNCKLSVLIIGLIVLSILSLILIDKQKLIPFTNYLYLNVWCLFFFYIFI